MVLLRGGAQWLQELQGVQPFKILKTLAYMNYVWFIF